MLVDSHCHLDFPELSGDLDGVLARAAAAGVGTMVTISTHLSTFPRVRAIAEAHAGVYCSVGVHPHEAAKEEAGVAGLVALAEHPKVVGIGETGLDFYYEHSPRAEQAESFRRHIAAARETGLPLIVHSRDADRETVEILQDEYAKGPFTGLIHCFSTGRELAEGALSLGFAISCSGILTFKSAQAIRDVVRDVPLERLLVETDAPFLAPVPHRGRANEPAYVRHTAKCLAGLKGVEENRLEEETTVNFFRVFSRAAPPSKAPAP
ncbi:MAG: TatD family hydrolase [Alphaproteobacteria bacterium]|nr:TatD family hydrolase [Alphaproteobacteria bacterium]